MTRREADELLFPDPPRRRPEPAPHTTSASTVVGDPAIRREGDTFMFTWPVHGVAIGVERIRETAAGPEAEVFVSATLGDLHWGRLHLASTSSRETLVRKLQRAAPGGPWRVMLEQVCREVVTAWRAGEPLVRLTPAQVPVRPRYLVEPLLLDDTVTVVYGDGGVGKGLVALAVAVAVSTGTALPGLRPTRVAPVLYLDWESDRTDHEERLALLQRGLDLADAPPIWYRRMVRPLADDVEPLRTEVARHDIGLVIIDSYMPAAGPEPEGADAASRLFRALRSLGTAALVVAHLTKAAAEQRTGPSSPWGSAFVKYLARSTWEVRRAETDEDGDLVLGLFHRKTNRDRLHPPLGLRFTFSPDMVQVRRHDIEDEPDLAVRMPLAYRVHQALREGAKTASEIADELEISNNVARALLSRARKQGKVVSLEERRGRETLWGLAAKG
jgi:hypothetical protein